ncbi:CinA family protein [Alistipes sp.]|uniref:CinA family protein n=1 Tax=Alistipes sp. TaxID=1872444 RepID=UPI003AEF6477
MNRLLLLLALLAASCHRTTPEERVHRLLTDRMLTLATAEGCTGGTIAARITALPGASAYFICGFVPYGMNAKEHLLLVSCDTIARYGAVSERVVCQMADGARRTAGTHYAIATTGIAGPTGGTAAQPVGTVWIAVSSPLRTTARLLHLDGRRPRIIREAGSAAISLLEEELLADNPSAE